MTESTFLGDSHGTKKGPNCSSGGWFFSRREIEENSPSRQDGIDLKRETFLRRSYCTFLQDLGMQLQIPQLTIATSVIFCHRFFTRQSHARNDRRTIATVCMLLAGKVEDSPRPLKDVIIVSYGIIHKKDPSAIQRIKQKEVYEQHKERILLGERLVLVTLSFDLNVLHPYKPLVYAIKRFNLEEKPIPRIAWNFVNDALRTSLWLQFKPHIIATAAICLATEYSGVKFPSDDGRVWWQDFDVTSCELEDVKQQMLELYHQKPCRVDKGNGSVGVSIGGTSKRSAATAKLQPSDGNMSAQSGHTQSDMTTVTTQTSAVDEMCGNNKQMMEIYKSGVVLNMISIAAGIPGVKYQVMLPSPCIFNENESLEEVVAPKKS